MVPPICITVPQYFSQVVVAIQKFDFADHFFEFLKNNGVTSDLLNVSLRDTVGGALKMPVGHGFLGELRGVWNCPKCLHVSPQGLLYMSIKSTHKAITRHTTEFQNFI